MEMMKETSDISCLAASALEYAEDKDNTYKDLQEKSQHLRQKAARLGALLSDESGDEAKAVFEKALANGKYYRR